MRPLTLVLIALLFFSCKKNNDAGTIKLLRTESTDNSGNVLHTSYGYDGNGRITSISQYINNAQPAVAVTISYNANEVVLLSAPATDPALNQNTTVHLTLDAKGSVQKRVEYTHAVAKTPAFQPSESFRYDTLIYEYDAAGFLKKTTGARYDSIWVEANYNIVKHFASTASYTMNAGNLVNNDEYVLYPIITRQNGVITISGGSSEYHNVYGYKKSFLNGGDFTNAAVLNEYILYYEPFLSSNYKNLPDQVIRNSVDKDKNGVIIFNRDSTIDIERTYNADGLLSAVHVLSQNTPYKEINYFYGR